jgi:hypothetical protein
MPTPIPFPMNTENTKTSGLLLAIRHTPNLDRAPGEKMLPYLTRNYEVAAGLKQTIPTPGVTAINGAIHARIDAALAKQISSNATAVARQAVRAVSPTEPVLGQPGYIAAKIARAAAPPASLAYVSESTLVESATHRFSPEAGRAEAIAELGRRGITVSASGIASKNQKFQIK